MRIVLNMKSVLKFVLVATSVWALSACSETADTGVPTAIPAVRVQCTTPDCRTNASPTTALVFTTSGCTAPNFGATLRYVSTSQSCSSTSGCNYSASTSGWTDENGNATATIPSGTYSLCGCLDLDRSSVPFENCDQEASYGPVLVDASTTQITLGTWN